VREKQLVMGYDPDKHRRRSIRREGYDYSLPGAYFVTLISYGRMCLFGEIKDGELRQSDIGKLVYDCWLGITDHFDNTKLDEYVIMPNHLHGIIIILDPYGKGEASLDKPTIGSAMISGDASPLQPKGTQPGSIGAIIQNFKSVTTRKVNRLHFEPGYKIWQKNYYERIIRNEGELNATRRYILDNPLNWEQDQENPKRKG
jgi:REP element-mobilizing transposase RayT